MPMASQRLSRLGAVHDAGSRIAFSIACAAIIMLCGAYCWEVIARYFFSSPTRWSSDAVSYALLLSVVLAMPQVTREGSHVAITSFTEKLSLAARHHVTRGIAVTGTFVCATSAIVFLNIARDQAAQGIETVAALAIPKWWLSACVAYGFADSALHLLRQAFSTHDAAGKELEV